MKCVLWYIFLVLLLVLPAGVNAQEKEQEAAVYLWRMVNGARVHPLETIHALGIEEAGARKALGADGELLDEGLPPLAWDASLAQAAGDHLDDMIGNLYYSTTGLDGSTAFDRIFRAGYDAAEAAEELLGAVSFAGFIAPLEAAQIVFAGWVRRELDPADPGVRRIFNPAWRVMGVGFRAAVVDLGEDIPANVYVAVADVAKPSVEQPFLFGNIYRDANGDGSMQAGEGLPGVTILVKSYLTGVEHTLVTTVAGSYSTPLPEGFFTVDARDGAGTLLVKRAGVGAAANYWMDVRVR